MPRHTSSNSFTCPRAISAVYSGAREARVGANRIVMCCAYPRARVPNPRLLELHISLPERLQGGLAIDFVELAETRARTDK